MQQSPDMTKAFWALRFCRALPPAHLIERCDALLAVGGGGGGGTGHCRPLDGRLERYRYGKPAETPPPRAPSQVLIHVRSRGLPLDGSGPCDVTARVPARPPSDSRAFPNRSASRG